MLEITRTIEGGYRVEEAMGQGRALAVVAPVSMAAIAEAYAKELIDSTAVLPTSLLRCGGASWALPHT